MTEAFVSALISVALVIPVGLLVNWLLSGYSKVSEARLIGESRGKYLALNLDEDFASGIQAWDRESVDACYWVVSILKEADPSRLDAMKPELLSFLRKCSTSTGLFRHAKRGETSIQATHCALSCFYYLDSAADLQQYCQRACESLMQVLGESTRSVDLTASDLRSILVLCSRSIDANLFAGVSTAELHESVLAHSMDLRDELSGAFRYSKDDLTPCVSATFCAVDVIVRVAPSSLDESSIRAIVDFLKSCYDSQNNAFSAVPGSLPNVVHTRMACEALEKLDQLESIKIRDVMMFLRRCVSEDGIALAPDMEPNLYALRNALDLVGLYRRGRGEETWEAALRGILATTPATLVTAILTDFVNSRSGLPVVYGTFKRH